MSLRILAVSAIILLLVGLAASAVGIDYVGLRITIPVGSIPFLVGIDLGTRFPSGWVFASLFVDQQGRTLLLSTYELAFSNEESTGTTFLALTAGLLHFDPLAPLPSFVFGGGFSYLLGTASGLQAGFTGEILYPLALGPPFFTLQGGWATP